MMYKLSFKNISQNPVRTITLGFFIFFVSFIMIVSNTTFGTINDNMENSLINTFTANVLLRKDIGENKDLFSMDAKWNKEDKLSSSEVEKLTKLIKDDVDNYKYGKRIRSNLIFSANNKKVPSMVVGLDKDLNEYEKSVKLKSGDYLNLDQDNQVVIMEEQAKKLNVKVGDTIDAIGMVNNNVVSKKLKVVGIGNMDLLSRFNFPAAFLNYDTVQGLSDFKEGEASDIAIYLDNKKDAEKVSKDIEGIINDNNLEVTSTAWNNLGGYIINSIGMYSMAFNGFIGVIMIVVAILIVNLVFMMGLERRQEIGTLKAIGFSKAQNIKIFMLEIVSVGLISSVLGAAVSGILINVFSKIPIEAGNPLNYLLGDKFYIQFDFMQLIIAVVVMVVLVIVASFYPCYKIASLKPAETLQEV